MECLLPYFDVIGFSSNTYKADYYCGYCANFLNNLHNYAVLVA